MMYIEGNLAYKLEPREEIIGGEVVRLPTQNTNHNRVYGNLSVLFGTYLKGSISESFSGTGLFLEEDVEEYLPDMMVVCDPDKVKDRGVVGTPDLVVEVLSHSTARYDRGHKMAVYERHGVREYWIIDPVGQNVEQYVLQEGKFVLWNVYHRYSKTELADMKEKEREKVVTEFPCGIFPDLVISLDRIFRRVKA